MQKFSKSHPILHIIAKNTFTLFNLVNLILVLMVISVGSFKNALFIGIAIANTLISIINEIRAYKIVQKMRLISEQKPTVIRDGKSIQVLSEEIKKGDITVLSLGDQILYDSIVKEGVLEVNESFITGEQDTIEKHPGDQLISGSFVVAGTAKAKVEKIGEENTITKLEKEAHYLKTADSKLFLYRSGDGHSSDCQFKGCGYVCKDSGCRDHHHRTCPPALSGRRVCRCVSGRWHA